MQMLVSRVITVSFNRRRIGSLQSRNKSSDAELVVDGSAVINELLGLGETTGSGDVGDDGSSRYHRSYDGPLMDAWTIFSPSSFPQTSRRLSRRKGKEKEASLTNL
jgi:hypothetical protein